MHILGMVPARGGSTRIIGKNKKDFLGKSLTEWAIEAGREAQVFDKFILSTDDPEIAEIGKKAGIEVPFLRPAELAAATSMVIDACRHAITWLKDNQGYTSDWFMLIEPTSPGRQPFHIQEVAKIALEHPEFDCVVGVAQIPNHFHPLRALALKDDGSLTRQSDGELIRNVINKGTQYLDKVYYINGSIYAFKTANLFKDTPSLWGDKVYGYVVDDKYSMDIDTQDDWLLAEVKMKALLAEQKKSQ